QSWLFNHRSLAADSSTGHADEQLGAAFESQFFAALHGQRACARRAADDQADGCAFAAASNAADDRPGHRTDAAAFNRLLATTARLHAPFFVNLARLRVRAINSHHLAAHRAAAPFAKVYGIERQIHGRAALDSAGLANGA